MKYKKVVEILKTDKLYEGQVFKNYRILCEELEMPIRSGKSKRLQMEDLHRFCATRREGHSIIISEIFDEPAPKIDGRGGKSIYGELLQVLFTDFFISTGSSRVTISRNAMLDEMKMVNKSYKTSQYNIDALSKETGVSSNIIHDFFNSTRGNFKYMVESTLDSLRDRALIMYDKVLIVSRKDSHTIATPYERETILQAEKMAMNDLGYETIGQVIASRKWEIYKSSIRMNLEKEDINYYYSSYDIVINSAYIEADHKLMLENVLDMVEREEKKSDLNSVICNRLIENAKRRKRNTSKESALYSTRNIETYEQDNELLVNLLVDRSDNTKK